MKNVSAFIFVIFAKHYGGDTRCSSELEGGWALELQSMERTCNSRRIWFQWMNYGHGHTIWTWQCFILFFSNTHPSLQSTHEQKGVHELTQTEWRGK